jgi:hypothetical protein
VADYAHKKSRPGVGRLRLLSLVLHQAFRGSMVVVLHAILVSHHLPVELVDQFVDRSIKVLMRTFGKHVAAFDMDIAFGALPSFLLLLFFHRQQHLDIDYLVKVANDSIKLGRDVTAQGWGNFEVMTADRQVHE